jgi:hypothetical protein
MIAFVNHCWDEGRGLLLRAAGLPLSVNSISAVDKERIATR